MRSVFKPCIQAVALRLLISITAGTLPGLAIGEEGELDRYEVELIVFRHLDSSRSSQETEAPTEQVFADPAADSLLNSADSVSRQPAPTTNLRDRNEPARFTPLPADRMKLGGIYQRLRQVDAYAPILHTGWTQEARSTAEAIPNRLGRAGGQARQSRLAGSVTLYKQRFLHLNLDLALESLKIRGAQGEPVLGNSSPNAVSGPRLMRLQESRRIRNEEVNYFDHPELGVIVTVREIVKASEVATEDES